MCARARGPGPGSPKAAWAALVDEVPGPYLWLKVWRPMEADAKTTDLQKLEVWPKHRAKTLDRPRPITCGRDEWGQGGGLAPSWAAWATLNEGRWGPLPGWGLPGGRWDEAARMIWALLVVAHST